MVQMRSLETIGRFVIVGIKPGEKMDTFVFKEVLRKELAAMQY